MKKQDRDSKGRFLMSNYYEIRALIKADNEKAQKIVKACDALGIKAEDLGVKQLEGGNWQIDHLGIRTLGGLAWGLTVALDKTHEEILDLLKTVADALGLLKGTEPETKAAEPKSAGARASA